MTKTYLIICLLTSLSLSAGWAQMIRIDPMLEGQKTTYATRKLTETLIKLGKKPAVSADGTANILVQKQSGIPAGGFSLAHQENKLVVGASDEQGALYGLLDLAQQFRSGIDLAGIRPKKEQPRLSFRAIKFNLPYMAYRTDASITQHDWTCRDPKFWEAFLDMMAENRFNVLSLWSLHPFHYMVKSKSFPEATQFNDFELGEWQNFWKSLFRMAHERGIETYLINWNTFVSPSFARAHNVGRYNERVSHFGNGDTTQITEQYTREIIRQVIDEYDDLDGLGITLGERMGGQSPEERRAWLDRTVFAGMRDAKRKIKFVYRAPLSADDKSGGTTSYENDQRTRRQVEGLDVTGPAYVEFKYNWSHGHSSPNLFMVHGGKLSDAYWNPRTDKLKAIWTVRNEDFFVLRWGQPDFIRQFIQNNNHDYVGGCFIGSEVFIPAKDYISQEGPHRNWQWHFQRNWLFYAVWGRLLYNPATPDAVFQQMLAERFGKQTGEPLLTAWKNASQVPLLFASYHRGNNDLSLYTEGFCQYQEFKEYKLFDVNNIINHPVLDTLRMVNISQYLAAGERTRPGIISPVQLADSLDRIATRTTQLVRAIRAKNSKPTLAVELADLEAWGWYARYFADKLRGGLALARFRRDHQPAQRQQAVTYLEKAVGHWKNYTQVLARYNQPSFLFHTARPFSWRDLQSQVEADVQLARDAGE